jgi:hypothetical protein
MISYKLGVTTAAGLGPALVAPHLRVALLLLLPLATPLLAAPLHDLRRAPLC